MRRSLLVFSHFPSQLPRLCVLRPMLLAHQAIIKHHVRRSDVAVFHLYLTAWFCHSQPTEYELREVVHFLYCVSQHIHDKQAKLLLRHHLIECICRQTTSLQHCKCFGFKCRFTGSPERHLNWIGLMIVRQELSQTQSPILTSLATLARSRNNYMFMALGKEGKKIATTVLDSGTPRSANWLQNCIHPLIQTQADPFQEPTKSFRSHEESRIQWKRRSHLQQHMSHVSVERVRWCDH